MHCKLLKKKINIPSELIDPEELITGQISDKNLVLYLTLFYNAFSDKDSMNSRESLIRRLHQLEEQIETVLNEKESLETRRSSLEEAKLNLSNELDLLTTERDELKKWKEFTEEEWNKEKKTLQERIAELLENLEYLKNASSDSTSKLQRMNEKLNNECDELMKHQENLKKTKGRFRREIKYVK